MMWNSFIPRKHKVLYLFLFVFSVKITTALLLSYLAQCSSPDRALGTFAYSSGDTFSYTGAMENYLQSGTYFFFNGTEKVYAGRLPHYSIPYWLLRQLFDQSTAYDLVVLFQVVMESLGIVALCIIAFRFFGNKGFYLLLLLLLLSTNWTDSSYYISPESISISVLALCLWQYENYKSTKNITNLFLSGLFFGWLTTLKIYYFLLLIPIGIEILLSERETLNTLSSWKTVLARGTIYVLPLILLLTPWIIRNYNVYQRIIPFQINQFAGYHYTDSDLACRDFIAAWGGDFTFWEKTSAGCYFHPIQDITCEFQYPKFLFSKTLQIRDVELVRRNYVDLQQNYSSQRDKQVRQSFERLTHIFKYEHPYYYYMVRPLSITIRFLKHSGSYYLPINRSNPCFGSWQVFIKLIQSMIYWMSLLLGMPGLFLLGVKQKSILFPYLPIFLIMLFPIFFHAAESRYFRMTEPILYFGIVYTLIRLEALFFSKHYRTFD